MTTLPHDYYLKFVDSEMLQQITDFHAKTNYTIHECVEHLSYLHRFSAEMLKTMAGNELLLYPDMNLTLLDNPIQRGDRASPVGRDESCERFVDIDLPFKLVESPFSPTTTLEDTSHKRGYASAGALYPIELFACSLSSSNSNWPCEEKVLHILPKSRKFEIAQNTSDLSTLKRALLPPGSDIGSPNLAVIYMAYLPKVIFKYRFRGYRMAHMETGSLSMLLDLPAKNLGLRNRVWSGYCDNMVSKSLGLNPALFNPLCVQFFGGAE